MRNFKLSRKAHSRRWAHFGALAWGPLVAATACNVYDGALADGVSAPLGGSGTDAGTAGVAAVGGSSAGMSMGGSTAGSAGSGAVAGAAGMTSTVGGSAGASGGGGSGGTAGSVAMAGTGGDPPSGSTEPIDDMEDADAEIEISHGRNGYWYVGGDPTAGATTDPKSGAFKMAPLMATDRSTYAAHLKAVGFMSWGSVIGFNFVELAATVKPYDASAYCGVQYWGKALAATTLRFRVPDGDTHQAGGVCTDGGGVGKDCYDHFGTSAAFSTAWKQFSVKFSELDQIGTGYHPADGKLKVDKLFALEWALPGSGKTYEIWLDDVEFLKCP